MKSQPPIMRTEVLPKVFLGGGERKPDINLGRITDLGGDAGFMKELRFKD